MGDILKDGSGLGKDIDIVDKKRLSMGFFKKDISYLALPKKELIKDWDDVDWDIWFQDNSDRILESRINFKARIELIEKGAFENWSADRLVFEEGIDEIEEEGIFAGEVNRIRIDGPIGKIGNGNFSNIFKLGAEPYENYEGAEFILNGDLGTIGEGVFSDAYYNEIVFKGRIEKIEDHKSYLVGSFTHLDVKHLRLPEGLSHLGKSNFKDSHFGYLALPSSLAKLEETSLRDSVVDILVVHNPELDLGDRQLRHAYRKLILSYDERPKLICHRSPRLDSYAEERRLDCEDIVSREESLEDNLYSLKLSLNETIKKYEKTLSLGYGIRLRRNFLFEDKIEELIYELRDGLEIKLEEDSLLVSLSENFIFDRDIDIKLLLKDINSQEDKTKLNKKGSFELEIF